MISRMKKVLALVLTVAMCGSLIACGSDNGESGNSTADGSTSTYDTLVIGTTQLDGVFNPFFATSSYDIQVSVDPVFANVCRLDKEGVLVDDAGHVEVEEVTAEDGHTQYLYTVSVQEGLTFSDGEPVTIDDVLFYYYVCADPTYDGTATFNTLDIVGLDEYINSAKMRWIAMSEAGRDNTDFSFWTEEEQTAFWDVDLPAAGAAFAQEIVDYLVAAGAVEDATDIAAAAPNWGYALEDGATTEDFWNAILANYEDDVKAASDIETAGSSIGTLLDPKYSEVLELADVDTITGINKVDDYTCTVLFDSPNISGDKQVAWIPIVPKHYYDADFTKGDLSKVKEKNSAPLGAGSYVFQSYENNVVTLTANESYFKGCPNIPTLKFQVVNENDKVDLVLGNEIDITDPAASLETVATLDENADKASYSLVDFPGYGYVGINAERIPDVNVRKGLMSLMNREPAVESYYGDLAHVIERPMTPTVAEYPDDAEPYYTYDTAKALEYFTAAGYTNVDGKLVNADGEQLVVTVAIGDASSHPATPIFTQMANDMEAMGAQLIVSDLEFNVLSQEVQSGNVDMWCMAWGNSTDCDLTQIFGSQGGSNYQHYYDPEIDAIQAQILGTVDFNERAELVAQELDMIMDAAVYMPIYQRSNMEIYNELTFDTTSLPEETTTFYNYAAEYQNLMMK